MPDGIRITYTYNADFRRVRTEESRKAQVPACHRRSAPRDALPNRIIWQNGQRGPGNATSITRGHWQAGACPTEHWPSTAPRGSTCVSPFISIATVFTPQTILHPIAHLSKLWQAPPLAHFFENFRTITCHASWEVKQHGSSMFPAAVRTQWVSWHSNGRNLACEYQSTHRSRRCSELINHASRSSTAARRTQISPFNKLPWVRSPNHRHRLQPAAGAGKFPSRTGKNQSSGSRPYGVRRRQWTGTRNSVATMASPHAV